MSLLLHRLLQKQALKPESEAQQKPDLKPDLMKCVSDALSIFAAECKAEAERGKRAYMAVARFYKDESTQPLVLDSVEEAERAKKYMLDGLSGKKFERCGAMVFKEGPYHRHKKRGRKTVIDKSSEYYLIKIKLSASW